MQNAITNYIPTAISLMPKNFKNGMQAACSNFETAKEKMKKANGLLFNMAGKPNAHDCAKANKLITEALSLI